MEVLDERRKKNTCVDQLIAPLLRYIHTHIYIHTYKYRDLVISYIIFLSFSAVRLLDDQHFVVFFFFFSVLFVIFSLSLCHPIRFFISSLFLFFTCVSIVCVCFFNKQRPFFGLLNLPCLNIVYIHTYTYISSSVAALFSSDRFRRATIDSSFADLLIRKREEQRWPNRDIWRMKKSRMYVGRARKRKRNQTYARTNKRVLIYADRQSSCALSYSFFDLISHKHPHHYGR